MPRGGERSATPSIRIPRPLQTAATRPGALTLQDGLPYAATASASRAVPLP